MTEALVSWFRNSLPQELSESSLQHLKTLRNTKEIINLPICHQLLGHEQTEILKDVEVSDFPMWTSYIRHRLQLLTRSGDSYDIHQLLLVGIASLNAFVQSNVTGPPLEFNSATSILPETVSGNAALLKEVRGALIDSFAVDGEAVYKLTSQIELFCLAKEILNHEQIVNGVKSSRWARLRVNFVHQRMLSEDSQTLQSSIQQDMDWVNFKLREIESPELKTELLSAFLVEKSGIQLRYGLDKPARQTLDEATKLRKFQYALTGMLGKKTKFQRTDISQLVVLAKSYTVEGPEDVSVQNGDTSNAKAMPKTISLDDDTLLESISFSKSVSTAEFRPEDDIPADLKILDPEHQPKLDPLDSTILLGIAASIKNTSPADGITREETLPYALRVLDGGSSNWQVYTQALLLRSRIEGYRSRTVERGLLQLQAVVDQVIAEVSEHSADNDTPAPTTFLPKPKAEEAASAEDRLLYVYQLSSPTRWELEAELAARWVSLGGLKTALEIYERLEMWPEVALCWAGTDREDKARRIIRRLLFHATNGNDEAADLDTESWTGEPRSPPPTDAPRLYCLLGDIYKDPSMYEKAWEVSNSRYYRAQKSLGQHWYSKRDYEKASAAFSKAVKVRQLDHPTWFSLGCALLELNQFSRAVEVFSRSVQLDDQDAESWSNLAVALLNLDDSQLLETNGSTSVATVPQMDEDEDIVHLSTEPPDPRQKHLKDALNALKQAAKLKRENYKIWDNLLTVAASIKPPSYVDIVTAQQRIIDIRSATDGEKCVDEKITNLLVSYITSFDPASDEHNPSKPGLARMACTLVDKSIVPLITASSKLWYEVARLALWRNKPSSALDAEEKAWRSIVQQPGWETGTEERWGQVVAATVRLVNAYKDLGSLEKTEGLSGGSGELVRKDWAFKGRSAVRGILGRGKESWEGTKGWDKLKEVSGSLAK